MNEEKVVRLFLKNGFQISKNALRLISDDPLAIMAELKKITPRPFIISEEHIKRVLSQTKRNPTEVKLIKEYTYNKEPALIADFVKGMSSRYEKIKSLLLKQMSQKRLVSVNKITPRTASFSIIGLVREKNTDSILVEDPTGEIILYLDSTMEKELGNVSLDDIIGIECKKMNEKYYATKILYPGVLASREINKNEDDIQIAVLQAPAEPSEAEQKKIINCLSAIEKLIAVFIFTDPQTSTKHMSGFNLVPLPTGSSPKLFGINEIKLLAVPFNQNNNPTEFTSASDVFFSMLKKRELHKLFVPSNTFNENYVFDEPPDIIISNLDGPLYQNYKGTTIISNSHPEKIFFINLKTREVYEKTI